MSGSLVGNPTSATKATKSTAQISMPTIRRFRPSGVIGVVGAWTGGRLDRLRREEQDGYREFTALLQRLRREIARPFGRSPRRAPRP